MVLLRAFHRSVIVLTSALAAAIRSFCEVGCWMMRVRHVDDVLHECAAIAGRPVPVIGEQVAALEPAREIMSIEHRQAVAHPVNALKSDPSVRFARAERLAQLVGLRRCDAVESSEVCLNYAVVTP